MDKNELITKLEAISVLNRKALSIKSKMNSFTPEDNYERKVSLPTFPGDYEDQEELEYWKDAIDHEEDDAIEQMMEVYDRHYCPKEPVKPKITEFSQTVNTETTKAKQSMGCFSIGAGLMGGIALISMLGNEDKLGLTICWIMLLISIAIFAVFFFRLKKAKDKDAAVLKEMKRLHEEKTQCELKDYEVAKEVYKTDSSAYKLSRQDFLDEYTEWRECYLESLKEEAIIGEKLEEDRIEGVNKIKTEEFMPVLEELDKINDVLAIDYLSAVDVIIDLLKTGRADDLKEAINLYEDILYRERELQLQREREEQRRREEELRRQDEERRYQDEKRFREDQERQRRREEERRARDEERRHNEEMRQREQQELTRQREEKRRQEADQRKRDREELDRKRSEDREMQRQCNTCALVGRCSMSFNATKS